MATDNGGMNTEEVKEAMENASSEEERRYLQRVLEHRGVRLASVSSHEIVAGNPDAYPEHTVEEQADLAIGRPHEPVSADELAVRGSVDTSGDDDKPAAAKRASSKK